MGKQLKQLFMLIICVSAAAGLVYLIQMKMPMGYQNPKYPLGLHSFQLIGQESNISAEANDQNLESLEINENRTSTNQCQIGSCSLSCINNYSLQHGYFPSDGSWRDIEKGYPHSHYNVSACKLAHPSQAPNNMRTYMKAAKPKTIVVIGDSQGRRYGVALMKHAELVGYSCSLVKKESVETKTFMPGKQYFLNGTGLTSNALLVARRDCGTCVSALNHCTNNVTKHEFDIEYISMTMTSKQSILPNQAYCKNRKNDMIC